MFDTDSPEEKVQNDAPNCQLSRFSCNFVVLRRGPTWRLVSLCTSGKYLSLVGYDFSKIHKKLQITVFHVNQK